MKWFYLTLLVFLVGCSSAVEINKSYNISYKDFEFEVLFDNLKNPWGMSFIDENNLLVTQKNTGLLIIDLNERSITDIEGIPRFVHPGQGGMLDVKYYEGFVYLTYVAQNSGSHSTMLGRGQLDGFKLVEFEVLHESGPAMSGGSHFGSRILIYEDKIYYTTGDRGRKDFGENHVSQDTQNTLGSVIRLYLNGSIPLDNPFVDNDSVLDEIYTFGHRNPQGITLNYETGNILISDHGERDGDEINILRAGANYGWPIAHTGCRYGTSLRFAEHPNDLDFVENPVYYFECGTGGFPPAGMTFYFGERYKELYGNLLIGNLAGQKLGRFSVNDREVEMLSPLFSGERVRDVIVSLDDYIYFITDSGKLVKVIS